MNSEAMQAGRIELLTKAVHAVFEPGVGHGEAEVAEANVEELLGR